MIYPKLKSIAKENNWYRSQRSVFGIYKNYLFTLTDGNGIKMIYVRVDGISDDVASQIEEKLVSLKKEMDFQSVTVGNDGIVLALTETLWPKKKEAIYAAMDLLVDILAWHHLPQSNCCQNCKTPDRLAHYHAGGIGILLCDSCFASISTDEERLREEHRTEDKYYVRGTIGAAVFSSAGIVAWVLLTHVTHRIFAAAGLAIGYLALKGYQVFKGRTGTWTPFIIISIAVASIVAANVASTIFSLCLVGFSFDAALEVLQTNREVIAAVREDTILSLVVCAFALFFFGKSLWINRQPNTVQPAELVE